MSLYRICLLLSCIGLTILAGIFIPGPHDTLDISRHSALGAAQIGGVSLQANTVLTLLTTLQSILILLCATVLIHHLVRIWLFKGQENEANIGLTAASLDAVFMNYLQMMKRLSYGLDRKDCTIFFIAILSLIMAQGSHTIFQLFLMDGLMQNPFETNIYVANTTHIIPALVQSFWFGQTISLQATFAGSTALLDGLLDVVGACDINKKICKSERETAPLIKCGNKTTECWKQIDVYSDFAMNCSSGIMPHGTLHSHRNFKGIISLSSGSNIFKHGLGDINRFTDQKVDWNIVQQSNGNGGFFAVYVNCTIFPAWSRRREHSVFGTQQKEIVQVFRRNQSFSDHALPTEQSTLLESIPVASPIAFTKSPTCLGFATPWCVLQIVNSMISAMDTDYLGVNADEFPRQAKSNPLSRLTLLSDPNILLKNNTPGPITLNTTMAAMYEMEMKFAVERMYKHILAGQFQQPEGITVMNCTDCSVQSTYWVENKILFMTLMGIMNGFAALCVLISIGLSIAYKSIEFNNIRMIEVVQLEAMGGMDLNYKKAEFEVKLRGHGSAREHHKNDNNMKFSCVAYEAL